MGAGESLIGTDVNLDQLSPSSALIFQKPLENFALTYSKYTD
jgi:hypothetical protein